MTDLHHSMSTLSIAPHPHSRSLRTHTATCTCYACSTGSQSKLVSWAVSESPRSPSPTSEICDKPWLLPTSLPNSPPIMYRRVARPIVLPARPHFDDDEDIMEDRARAHEIPITPQMSWKQQLQPSQYGHPLKPSPTFQSLSNVPTIHPAPPPPSSSSDPNDSTPHSHTHTLHIHPSPSQLHTKSLHLTSSSFQECKLDCESTTYHSPFQHWRETTRTPTSITV